jgi:hypothetical protein
MPGIRRMGGQSLPVVSVKFEGVFGGVYYPELAKIVELISSYNQYTLVENVNFPQLKLALDSGQRIKIVGIGANMKHALIAPTAEAADILNQFSKNFVGHLKVQLSCEQILLR